MSPGFFETMKVPLIRGRLFTRDDSIAANQTLFGFGHRPVPPEAVLINQSFAQRFFPDEDPIGKRLQIATESTRFREVVGVVGNAHLSGLEAKVDPAIYVPFPATTRSHLAMNTGGATLTSGNVFRDLRFEYVGRTIAGALNARGYGAQFIHQLRVELRTPDVPWLRVLYLYPQRMSVDLLRTLAELPQVCKYVDIPLQHIHQNMLERMRRETTRRHLVDLIARLRAGHDPLRHAGRIDPHAVAAAGEPLRLVHGHEDEEGGREADERVGPEPRRTAVVAPLHADRAARHDGAGEVEQDVGPGDGGDLPDGDLREELEEREHRRGGGWGGARPH